MRFTQLKKILLFAVLVFACGSAFAADCNTSGYPCMNLDSQIKGSRWPAWGIDSGAANAYAVATVAPLGPGLKTGSKIQFIAVHSNTAASTLAVNGGSAIALVNPPATALTSGNIVAGDVIEAVYDGTNFQCITCATSSGGGGTGGSFSNSGIPGSSVAPSLSLTGTTGSTTYGYCIVANLSAGGSSSGGTTACSPANFFTNGNATLTSSNFVSISWTAVTGASSYDVYRSFSGGTPATFGKLTSGDCPAATGTSCHDKGDTANGVPSPGVNTSGQTVAASYATAGGYGTADPRYQVYLKDEFCGKAGDLGWTTTGTITITWANGNFNVPGGVGTGSSSVNEPCTVELAANSTVGALSLGAVSGVSQPYGLFALNGSQPLMMRVYARMIGGFSTANGTLTNQQIGLTSNDGLGSTGNPFNVVTFLADSPGGTYGDFGCYTAGSGIFGTHIDSGVSHDTNWHWFEIDFSPTPSSSTTNPTNGTVITFKIDHNVVCRATQALGGHSYNPFFGVANNDSAQGDMQIDYFDLTFAVNRP